MAEAKRNTATSRELQAGCYTCHGSAAHWTGVNAQALAARHHDITDHPTWCNVQLAIVYGMHRADPRQIDIEAAIAASSGSAPECAPLPDPDSAGDPPPASSAPKGRTVETGGSCRPGARGTTPEILHA